ANRSGPVQSARGSHAIHRIARHQRGPHARGAMRQRIFRRRYARAAAPADLRGDGRPLLHAGHAVHAGRRCEVHRPRRHDDRGTRSLGHADHSVSVAHSAARRMELSPAAPPGLTGNWKLETRNSELETGNWKLETGWRISWRPPKSKTCSRTMSRWPTG